MCGHAFANSREHWVRLGCRQWRRQEQPGALPRVQRRLRQVSKIIRRRKRHPQRSVLLIAYSAARVGLAQASQQAPQARRAVHELELVLDAQMTLEEGDVRLDRFDREWLARLDPRTKAP